MLNRTLARRYARALFELASEMSVLDQIDRELSEITDLIAKNQELKYFLNHPNIEAEAKRKVLGTVLVSSVSEISRNFVFLLIDRRRENYLGLIQKEFSRLANKARNIVEVKVTSAVTLSAEQEENLKGVLVKNTGKNVQLTLEMSPKLIGGAKLQIGDRVMDGSVSTALAKLGQELRKSSSKPQQEVGVS